MKLLTVIIITMIVTAIITFFGTLHLVEWANTPDVKDQVYRVR